MIIVSAVQRVLRLQYAVVRLPLAVIDDKVVHRLDRDAPPRIVFDRLVGVMDSAAGMVLGLPDLAEGGEEKKEDADTLAKAVAMEQRAKIIKAAAAEKLAEETAAARERQDAIKKTSHEALADAADEEIENKIDAGTKANERLSQRKDQADAKADARIKDAEDTRKAVKEEIDKRQDSKTKPHKEQLESADRKGADAEDKKEDAERLKDLAQAERNK